MVDADLRKAVPVNSSNLSAGPEPRFRKAVCRSKPPAPHGRAGLCARRDRRGFPSKGNHIRSWSRSKRRSGLHKSGAADDAPRHRQGRGGLRLDVLRGHGKANRFELSDADNATSEIINSIEQKGLGTWLDDVRRYHEGTFQHCLLVTGVAVGFALDIKFANADVKRLGLAATLHDIGKARIPLSILDKPGRLDPGEEEIMKRHPVIGYELLKASRDQPGDSRRREAPPRISGRLWLSRWR